MDWIAQVVLTALGVTFVGLGLLWLINALRAFTRLASEGMVLPVFLMGGGGSEPAWPSSYAGSPSQRSFSVARASSCFPRSRSGGSGNEERTESTLQTWLERRNVLY